MNSLSLSIKACCVIWSTLWSTVSNEAQISKNSFDAKGMSLLTFSNAVWLLRLFLKPDWNTLSWLLSSKRWLSCLATTFSHTLDKNRRLNDWSITGQITCHLYCIIEITDRLSVIELSVASLYTAHLWVLADQEDKGTFLHCEANSIKHLPSSLVSRPTQYML